MKTFGIFFTQHNLYKGTLFTGWITTDKSRKEKRLFETREDAVDFLCDREFDYCDSSSTFVKKLEHVVWNLQVVQVNKLKADFVQQKV